MDLNRSKLKDEIAQPLIAALYARVSTGRQEQEATIESQLDEIKARIKLDGNILPPENIFIDDGWTGEILQRPSLDLMRDAAQVGNFQILYVYDRGRISRVFAHQEVVLEELLDKDIEFETLHDMHARTAEERVMQAMQGVFHEYERVKIVERMRRGKMFKAKSGVLINGSSLYGWDYVKKSDTEPTHYSLNENEARVVNMMFNWIGNEGISINEIIRKLYELGIPTKKQKSEFWTKGPITRILRNESYVTGVIYYNKTEAVVAKKTIKQEKYKKVKRNSRKAKPKEDWIPYQAVPILNDKDLFVRVQKILDLNQKYAQKNRKHDYLLSEVISCGCGNRRAGDGCNDTGHYYYRCEERLHNFPAIQRKCKIKGINAQVLDSLLWDKLTKNLTDPSLLRQHAEEWLRIQSMRSFDTKEKNRLEDQLARLDEEKKRYAKLYGEGSLSFDQVRDLLKDAEKRESSSKKQLAQIQATIEPQTIDIGVDELYEEAKRVIENMDLRDEFVNKKQLVRAIIDNIIIKERSEVEVWAHIPFTSLNTLKLEHEPISRNCWVAKCGEIHIV